LETWRIADEQQKSPPIAMGGLGDEIILSKTGGRRRELKNDPPRAYFCPSAKGGGGVCGGAYGVGGGGAPGAGWGPFNRAPVCCTGCWGGVPGPGIRCMSTWSRIRRLID
jgi:hypothetical protein